MTAATLGLAIHVQSKIKHQPRSGKPLSWQTPIKAVCPDFTLQDHCAAENTTIEDILSHRSGMSGDDTFYGPWMGNRLSDVTKRAKYLGPLTKQFRTGMQYNNWMISIAGDVLERVSGLECGEAIKKWLWDPIGMKRTSWHLRDIFKNKDISVAEDMSRGYFWVEPQTSDREKGYYVPERFLDLAGIAPAGATISSVLDYAKWMKVLMGARIGSLNAEDTEIEGHGNSRPEKVLSKKLFEELTTPRTTDEIDPQRILPNSQMIPTLVALGWFLPSSALGALHPIITHGGGLNGYGTELLMMPNDDFGVVTMGNTGGTSNIVGSILTLELILRKMGLKELGREKERKDFCETFMPSQVTNPSGLIELSMSTMQGVRSIQQESTKLSPDQFIPAAECSYLRQYEGIYRNESHGEFRVMLVPVPLDCDSAGEDVRHRRLVYSNTDSANMDIKEEIRSRTFALQVDPMHERTWKWSFMLRPRNSVAGSQATQDFDQEMFRGFGMFEGDVTNGIPTGVDKDSVGGHCREEDVWLGILWSTLGASIIKDPAPGGHCLKLGLTTANELFVQPGDREEGWKSKLTWFDKVSNL